MSAICGILTPDDRPASARELDVMMRVMQKHGPDGSATWHDGPIALGHQAMHITPESVREEWPLHHAPSGTALIAEARIDNREELAQTLGIAPGRHPTDGELILAAYLKWGTVCVDHLVGEFAIAIWDARERCLHCITDPMGIRPLYYAAVPGKHVAFASEIEPLLNVLGTPALDNRRLAMLGLSAMTVYLEPDRTCFENVKRIPAATVMTFDANGMSSREYWRPDPRKRIRFTSEDECAEAFREVFANAVEARLRGVSAPAALLSGGLDSSAIVGMASRLLNGSDRKLRTFSIVPELSAEGRVLDERAWIDRFRETPNLVMEAVAAEGAGPFDDPERLVSTGALCSYGFQHYMYSALVRAAKRSGVRVLLDGYGGELAASGYMQGYFAELLRRGRIRRLVSELKHSNPASPFGASVIKSQILRPLVPFGVLKRLNRHARLNRKLSYPVRADFVQDMLGDEVDSITDRLSRLLLVAPDHRKNMADRILRVRDDARQRSHAGFVDYQDARFSYPYLDRRVLEFGLAVDGRFKYRDGESRRLIRSASRGLIPEAIRNRTTKAPFCPDYHLRYSRQKDIARRQLNEIAQTPSLEAVVDFDRVFSALEKESRYLRENPMVPDYDTQFLVPYALYLCYFLTRFNG